MIDHIVIHPVNDVQIISDRFIGFGEICADPNILRRQVTVNGASVKQPYSSIHKYYDQQKDDKCDLKQERSVFSPYFLLHDIRPSFRIDFFCYTIFCGCAFRPLSVFIQYPVLFYYDFEIIASPVIHDLYRNRLPPQKVSL